jgi:hypothetical protein
MIRHLRTALLALALFAACLVGGTPAQTGPTVPPKPARPANLSEADLEKALGDRDPGLKVHHYSKDRKIVGTRYSFSVRVGKEAHQMAVLTSRAEDKILIVVPLTKRLPKLPAKIEAQLGEFNRRLAPCWLEKVPWDVRRRLRAGGRTEVQSPGDCPGLANPAEAVTPESRRGPPAVGPPPQVSIRD